MDDLTAWQRAQSRALSLDRWRGVLWIAEDPVAAVDKARRWIEAGSWQSPLWIGPENTALADLMPRLPASRARSQLGSERDLVVFDAASPDAGFDPDAFGAISGTVVAGGWLILLTPKHWQQSTGAEWCPDADYRRLAHWPHEAESLTARYLARLAARLASFENVAVWPPHASLPVCSFRPSAPASPAELRPSVDDPDCLTKDQAEAVARLTRMRRRRPVVLVADRGRGKSAALGIAAARRLGQGENLLWVTSATATAADAIFERLVALLPHGRREAYRFDVSVDGRACRVEWLPPEQVVPALQGGGIDARSPPTLLVDEAASIPASRLTSWLKRFPRIAFATTVHGYEGTGRGFEVRLRDSLDRLTPDWKRLTMRTPIRWGEGDPLEALTRDLLCLDAEAANLASGADTAGSNDGEAIRYLWLDRAALADDETLLNQVFGLLVQAHYRTSPSDLRQLLDGPDIHLLTACAGEDAGSTHVVGICVVQQEGGFDPALAAEIHTGRRRPRGHLLAQSLATHGGYVDAALARWWRIMRIAVHPAARRQGIGAALVAEVASAAGSRGLDRLGVSYGAELSLIRFWRRQGFRTLRVGLTREASSGEPAQMMGRGLTPEADRVLARMGDDFVRWLPDLLAAELREIEPLVVAAWLHEGEAPALPDDLAARLAWFHQGGGELALIRPWLRLAWLAWWREQPLASVPDTLEIDVDDSGERDDPTQPSQVAAAVATLFQYDDEAFSPKGRRERAIAARQLAKSLSSWQRA